MIAERILYHTVVYRLINPISFTNNYDNRFNSARVASTALAENRIYYTILHV